MHDAELKLERITLIGEDLDARLQVAGAQEDANVKRAAIEGARFTCAEAVEAVRAGWSSMQQRRRSSSVSAKPRGLARPRWRSSGPRSADHSHRVFWLTRISSILKKRGRVIPRRRRAAFATGQPDDPQTAAKAADPDALPAEQPARAIRIRRSIR